MKTLATENTEDTESAEKRLEGRMLVIFSVISECSVAEPL
jgi:hypothetical protein